MPGGTCFKTLFIGFGYSLGFCSKKLRVRQLVNELVLPAAFAIGSQIARAYSVRNYENVCEDAFHGNKDMNLCKMLTGRQKR